MFKSTEFSESYTRPGTPLQQRSVSRIPVVAFGMGLGLFLALTFVLCVLFDLWFPAQAMNWFWAPLLPGFTWINSANFFLGLVETFAYGWFIALVFGPLYNFFVARARASVRPSGAPGCGDGPMLEEQPQELRSVPDGWRQEKHHPCVTAERLRGAAHREMRG